jgi:4-diphosphocytidyl-2-C-methyl-D-erythritol kinase
VNRGLPDTVRVRAPAKVNLFLRVLGRRPDGYHELETLIAPIELADRLEIHAHSDPGQFRTLALSLEVIGDPDRIRGVPVDESNLVLRAARTLADAVGARGFADITLEKLVPTAAGLGGGSSDAAATLRALNELWRCGLDEAALRELGLAVGSDVPALVGGDSVVARGRGERIEPFPLPSLSLGLVLFPFGVSTADAFRWWDEDGGRTGPDPGDWLSAAAHGGVEALGALLHNDLEDVVVRRFQPVHQARDRLLQAGAVGVVMCGSGPTLAALLRTEEAFHSPSGLEVLVLRTANPEGEES